MIEAAVFVVFPFCLAYAAVSDMLSMTVANRVPVILVAAFAVLAPLTGMAWSVYGMHFLAGGLVLAATFGLFALGGMGGGDAKLMAATAVWMGFGVVLIKYLVFSSFVGGALTLALLAFRNSFAADFAGSNLFLRHFADRKAGIPYAIALGIGGIATYPETELVQWALARLTAG